MKLSELLKQANLSHKWTTDENFPVIEDNKPIELYQPPKAITGYEILQEFKNTGYEPGKIEQIVQYAIDHPKNDENINNLTALGSTYHYSGVLRVPYLDWNGDRWVLGFGCLGSYWSDNDHVARCKVLGSSDTWEGTRTLGALEVLYCGHCGSKLKK